MTTISAADLGIAVCSEPACEHGATNACGFCDYHCPHGQPHRPVEVIEDDALAERLGLDMEEYNAYLSGDIDWNQDSLDDKVRQHLGLTDDDAETMQWCDQSDLFTDDEVRYLADGPSWSVSVPGSDGPEFERALDKFDELTDSIFVHERVAQDPGYELVLDERVTEAGARTLAETLQCAGCAGVQVYQ